MAEELRPAARDPEEHRLAVGPGARSQAGWNPLEQENCAPVLKTYKNITIVNDASSRDAPNCGITLVMFL